jgi:hypothetical protein
VCISPSTSICVSVYSFCGAFSLTFFISATEITLFCQLLEPTMYITCDVRTSILTDTHTHTHVVEWGKKSEYRKGR